MVTTPASNVGVKIVKCHGVLFAASSVACILSSYILENVEHCGGEPEQAANC